MAKRVILLFLLLNITSSILNCFELNGKISQSLKMFCSDKTISKTPNPCCCNRDYKSLETVSRNIDSVAIKHNNNPNIKKLENFNSYRIFYKINDLTTFYQPLKKIRLLI